MGKIMLNDEEYGNGNASSLSHYYHGQTMSVPITLNSPVGVGEQGTFSFTLPRSSLYGDGYIVNLNAVGGWAEDANGDDLGYVFTINCYYSNNYPSSGTSADDTCDFLVHGIFINTTNDDIYSFPYIDVDYIMLY